MGMPLLRFLFRKMWNTRWMTLTTLLGLIIAVAFTSGIPMYSDGALKRLVSESLEEENAGLPAGSLLFRYQAVGNTRTNLDAYKAADAYIQDDVPGMIGFPYYTFVETTGLRATSVTPVDPSTVDNSRKRNMAVVSMNEIGDYIELTNGKMFADELTDGAVEAIVYEEALSRNSFRVGDEFYYQLSTSKGVQQLRVKVVGSFEPLDVTNPYWYQGFEPMTNYFIISDKVMQEELLGRMGASLNASNWFYVFDLREITTSQLAPLSSTLDRIDIEVYQKLEGARMTISFKEMLGEFRSQSMRLQMLLFTLAAPMIVMVFYFIAMNARQSLERQRSDIAVLRSRGASTGQIVWIYLLEGLLLGGLALVIGPMLGWFVAKSIGSSDGFLTFVNRKAIPVDVSATTFIYAGLAVLIAVGSAMIPAIMFARSTIVGLKQQMARADRKPLWHRFYLDVVLLALSGYGWYMFYENQYISMMTGLTNDQLQVDPLLFFVPAVSIFALGLFFLRLFPWILRLLSWLGGKWLRVPLYLTLTQLSRSAKAYYPLMILLILTLGMGVYNSSAARTIDLNSTEQLLYRYGSDVIVKTVWEGYSASLPTDPGLGGGGGGGGSGGGGGGSGGGGGGGGGGDGGDGGGNPGNPNQPNNPGNPGQPIPTTQMFYREPPFEIYRTLDGVKYAAKVLRTNASIVVSGRSKGQGELMGIQNDQFAPVAWWRLDMYPKYHPYAYLDALGQFENAVIVSQKFAEENLLQPGDTLSLVIQQNRLDFVIVGTVPYWPTQYPDQTPFFIVNLDYIYDQIPMIPYEVWLKMEEGALLAPIIEGLQQNGIQISSIKDVRRELVTEARHPSRGGVYGILSLGFLISVIISLIGYLLYWFYNLSSRVVQFGVLRAMGLSRRQLTGMLLLEQVFTAGLSIALGLGIGRLASYLYLPFLQTSENVQQQVPPFRVIFDAKDDIAIYIVVCIMLAIGAAMLFMHIRRLRVHQAVKLGEER